MGKFAQITWPEDYSELQRIEELLLCGICYEYMDTTVMTPCSHNYCSLCIRKYLHYKTQCPACFEKTFEKDLHTNRILDEIVSYFGKIREKLARCIVGAKIGSVSDFSDESVADASTRSTPVRPARANHGVKKASPKVIDKAADEPLAEEPQTSEKVCAESEQQKIFSSPSTSGVSRIAAFFTPKSKKNLVIAADSGDTVPCPVCAVDVSTIHINKHLDACLKRETTTGQAAREEPKRKPLPKLVFSLMKDAQLRKKMKELGLPSQGDRKTLEARFHRYSVLYNAECDKREPRPIEELLKQCENEENLEKKMLKFAQAANRLKVTRNCEQNVIEEAQKKYLESNRQNYSDLIAAIKERGKSRKPPVRRSLIDQEIDSRANGSPGSRSLKNDSLENAEDPVCYSMSSYAATFHDSDSNSSCPLQHYASDDPMNFLSLKMATSEDSVSPTKNTQVSVKSEDTTACDTREDVYNATTDEETSDEDVVPPSPNATMSRTTKRPKMTSETTQSSESCVKVDERLEGHKLAMSIARDFTFDSSSNDSLVNETANQVVDNNGSKKQAVKDEEIDAENVSRLDKENEESSSPTNSLCVVNRPLRKRKCLARLASVDAAEQTRPNARKATSAKLTGRGNDNESRGINGEENEKLSPGSRLDSPSKRRRGRKIAANEAETKEPPRRPLRKRLVNSTSTDEAHK